MCVCVCVCVCFVVGPKTEKGNISKWIGPLGDLHLRMIYYVLTFAYVPSYLLHKAIWMGHPMRVEKMNTGLSK